MEARAALAFFFIMSRSVLIWSAAPAFIIRLKDTEKKSGWIPASLKEAAAPSKSLSGEQASKPGPPREASGRYFLTRALILLKSSR